MTAAKIIVRVSEKAITCELPDAPHAKSAIKAFMGNGTEERLKQLHDDAKGEIGALMPPLVWLLRLRVLAARAVSSAVLEVEVVRGELRKPEPEKKPRWEWPFGKGSTQRDYSHIEAPKIPTGDGAPPLT